MEPGGSMQHSQGVSNNPYPEPNQPNSSSMSILILSSHLRLVLLNGLFHAGLTNCVVYEIRGFNAAFTRTLQ